MPTIAELNDRLDVAADFRNWVLYNYPEDEKLIEGIPNNLLKGFYPDVHELGPAAKKIQSLYASVIRLSTEVDANQFEDMVGKVKGLNHRSSGHLGSFAKVLSPSLRVSLQKNNEAVSSILPYATGGPSSFLVDASFYVDKLYGITSAYTILQFADPETEWWFTSEEWAMAETIVNSWESIVSKHESRK